jgi:hypothetical protein
MPSLPLNSKAYATGCDGEIDTGYEEIRAYPRPVSLSVSHKQQVCCLAVADAPSRPR